MKRMPRRIFTEEFKKEAVRLFKEQDLTLAEVSQMNQLRDKELQLARDAALTDAEKDVKLKTVREKQIALTDRYHRLYRKKVKGS